MVCPAARMSEEEAEKAFSQIFILSRKVIRVVLYCHLVIHAGIYIYMLDTYRSNELIRRSNKRHRKTSLTIFTSHFICKIQKGCSRFACERELETKHNCNILTPHSYGRHVVSFLFSWCSTGGLGGHSAGWSATSYQQLLRSPNSITAGCGFPYHIYHPTGLELQLCLIFNSTATGSSNSTELYNCSTPTRSLKSNV